MPWTGPNYVRDNGVFTGPLVWTDDRDALTKIVSDHHDTHDQDIADGITACLNKNGANSAAADISWGGHKITSLAAGAATTDAAQYGQTITAATLDPVTNILSMARTTGGDVTVDLSALVLGGSTAPFARLASTQAFTGVNTFNAVHVTAGNGVTLDAGTGSILQWDIYRDNVGFYILRNGGEFLRIPNAGNAFYAASHKIWTEETLTPTQVANMVSATGNYTISGAYVFTNANTKLAPHLESSATGGGDWGIGPSSATQYDWNEPLGLTNLSYIIDAAPTAGAYLQIGTKRAWDQGSLKSALTAAPTGGENGNLAVVQSGADRGLWTKIAGVWTKLIAFP